MARKGYALTADEYRRIRIARRTLRSGGKAARAEARRVVNSLTKRKNPRHRRHHRRNPEKHEHGGMLALLLIGGGVLLLMSRPSTPYGTSANPLAGLSAPLGNIFNTVSGWFSSSPAVAATPGVNVLPPSITDTSVSIPSEVPIPLMPGDPGGP